MTRRRSVIVGLAAIAVAAITAVLVATSDVLEFPVAAAVVRTGTVLAWVLCGVWTWHRRPESRLGPIMTIGGFVYSLGALNAIDAPLPFSIGSLLWVAGAYLVALVALVFPDGRLPDRTARTVAVVLTGTAALLWTVLLFGAETMPTPAKPFDCAAGCPSNPLDVLGLSASATDALEGAAFGVFGVFSLVLIAVLVARIRTTSPAGRRILLPPTACLCFVAATFVVAFVVARTSGDGDAGAAGWLPNAASVLFPVLILFGQARGRLFAAGSLRDMVSRVSTTPGGADLESVMADALGEPSLRLAFPVGQGGYVDGSGRAIAVPGAAGVSVTEIRDGSHVTAVILHDPVLDETPGMVEAAGSAIQLALDNVRLEADVRASARDLRESRSRLLTAGVAERRRLERDLHDTAQQRLVALRIKFALAEERADGDLGTLLGELGADVEATIDSVRDVGRGLYPPLLADQGVGGALTSTLGQLGGGVDVSVGTVARSDQNVEAAVYLCCRSVIELLARHAPSATRVELEAEGDDLRISVAATGSRELSDRVMLQMRDHVGSLGGRVRYANGDDGWRIDGLVPWPPG